MATYRVFYEVEYKPNENACQCLENEKSYFPKRFLRVNAEIDGLFADRIIRKKALKKAENANNSIKHFTVGCDVCYSIFDRLYSICKHSKGSE